MGAGKKESRTMATTLIIDRDTITTVLDTAEMADADRVKLAIDIVAGAVESELGEDSGVVVVREYRTTGRRSTAEGLESVLERVLIDNADSIRAATLG